jgi:hypothetical protein
MPSKNYPVEKIGSREVVLVPVSFETNEVGTFKLPSLGYRTKLIAARSVVNKTVAGSDAGTITVKHGNTTLATITVALSSAIGDEDTAPSVTEDEVEATGQYTLVTAKSTAGGRAIAALTLEVLPSHSN